MSRPTPVIAVLALAALAVLGAAGCAERRSLPHASDEPPSLPECGHRDGPRSWEHVVWVVMENHGNDAVLGSTDAPYLRSLARRCGVATGYSAITHPSLPNYVALTTGGTQGIRNDGPPADNTRDVPSIFSQLTGDWRTYAESMPRPCARTDSGGYAVRHNPPTYFKRVGSTCARNDLPLPNYPSLDAAFTFIAPNLCHDMHDCSVATGDRWLSTFLPKLVRSEQYREGATAIFVTWDEDEGGDSENQVPLFAVAPSVRPGTAVSDSFDHYSLLRTTEDMLGVPPLGSAADASSMRRAFGL
jgi:phosphatidylinositol-3-phosphatase